MDIMGAEKVCMGSDYPFPLGEQVPGKLIESMHFSDGLKQQLLWDNAMRWLHG